MMLNAHLLEIMAVACCFINIYLAARAHLLNFCFGALAVSLYFFIFYQAKLYADMSLQLVFLALQFYGAYQWVYRRAKITTFSIEQCSFIAICYACIGAAILFAVISYILRTYTDSTTVYMDAAITALSLVAQWMMSKKWLANWWLWMLVDVLSIKIYLVKHLYFTSILYVVLLMLCIYGYIHWKKQYAAVVQKS